MYRVIFFIGLFISSLSLAATSDLGDALKNPAEIKDLDLSYQKLPDTLDWSVFTSLESLKLDFCGLRELDSSFSQMKTLKSLSLDGNIFSDLIKEFDKLSHIESLEELSLENCFLLFIPNSIGRLENLKDLNLNGNKIFDLPISFHGLNHLEKLTLSGNNLDTLSFAFIGHRHLKSLDLSDNPHLEKERAIEICSRLPFLKELTWRGLDTLPKSISKLEQIEYLDLSNGQFYTFPEGLQGLKGLTHLSVKSDKILWDQMIEMILYCPKLSSLMIGGCGLTNIPFNLMKLKKLKKLKIEESILKRTPSRLSSMKLKSLELEACYISDIKSLSRTFTSNRSLEKLVFQSCQFSKGEFIIGKSLKWKGIDAFNSNFRDVTFIESEKQWTFKSFDCSGLNLLEDIGSIQLIEKSSSKHLLKEKYQLRSYYDNITPKQVTVYGEVGLVVDINDNILVEFPEKAFLNSKNEVVDGEVEVLIYFAVKPVDQLKFGVEYQLGLLDKRYYGVSPDLNIKIEAFKDGERLELNLEKKILIKWFYRSTGGKLYSYDKDAGLLSLESALEGDSLQCFNSSYVNPFDEIFESYQDNKPVRKSNIRHSQVYLKVKKGKRNKPFHFYLEPEYGFNEKYIPLLGNKVKAYSEFKAYKGIRWNYRGDNQQQDYESLYKLTDTKPERLKRKSSMYLYVLDLNDISLKPSDKGDFYEFKMYRGFDTLKLAVLPSLSITSASKLQKWHKKKYLKYLSLLEVRKEKWNRLDSLDLLFENQYYSELNDFRKNEVKRFELKIEKPLLQEFHFDVNLNHVFVIGSEVSNNYEYFEASLIDGLDLQMVESFTSISTIGELVQCSGTRFALLSSKMIVVIHFKDGSLGKFSFDEGQISDLMLNRKIEEVLE